MDNFTGRAAVVTGAASGIGLALAERAASAGMTLVLADVDTDGLATVAASLGSVEVVTQRCDVSDAEQVAALAATTFERFGTPAIVCNNAGVGGGGRLADIELADWKWTLGVNLWGVIHGVDAFLRPMIESGEPGHFINTASMAGHISAPGMGPYSVSKYGVVALSETMRGELAGSAVGVSVLCPGWVATRIHESGRSRPAEYAVDREPPPQAMRDMMRQVIESGHAPSTVADRVFAAIEADDFWIFTHDEMMTSIEIRYLDLMSARPGNATVAAPR